MCLRADRRVRRICDALTRSLLDGEAKPHVPLIGLAVLALDRPDACLIFFERIDVDHPVEDDGAKSSAGRVASLLCGD